MRFLFILQAGAVCYMNAFILTAEASCMHPPPSQNFTNQKYNGLWYEIGKMQTAGGAAFEKDCVCTTIAISAVSGGKKGDSTAFNSCRKLTPTGSFLNATGEEKLTAGFSTTERVAVSAFDWQI